MQQSQVKTVPTAVTLYVVHAYEQQKLKNQLGEKKQKHGKKNAK